MSEFDAWLCFDDGSTDKVRVTGFAKPASAFVCSNAGSPRRKERIDSLFPCNQHNDAIAAKINEIAAKQRELWEQIRTLREQMIPITGSEA